MQHLMHIGFDNSSRLCRDIYYFEYKGIRYKLIQNNIRKWRDVLLTIVEDDKRSKDQAYIVASEFLTALSWQNHSCIKLSPLGGNSVPDNYDLRKAKCTFFDSPQIPFNSQTLGHDICIIPEIENDEQRTALVLFREATSAYNNYLSFLFYWQVMEMRGTQAAGWVDRIYKKDRSRLRTSADEIGALPLRGKTLGNYLLIDCRHAIAHITRRAGEVSFKLDTPEDNRRIAVSTKIVKEFAYYYIWNELGLSKKMYLIKNDEHKFPAFVTETDIRKTHFVMAYSRLSPDHILKKAGPFPFKIKRRPPK